MGIDARIYVDMPRKVTPDEANRLAYDIASAFGADRFCTVPPGKWADEPKGRRAISRITKYEQDGPTVSPKAGHTFLQIHLATRYYGKGYERGDWPLISGIVRWLGERCPEGRVFYGGDSSSVIAEEMTLARLAELDHHFALNGHAPYYRDWSGIGGHDEAMPPCRLCEVPLRRYGYGATYIAARCPGCGWDRVSRDNGQTWEDQEADR